MSYGEACWRQCCPIGSHLNFFWRVSRKNAKTGNFLHLVKLSEILLLHHISRVPPCESWRPDGSENVGLIGFLSFWTGVIAAQSRKKVKFSGTLAKISGVTKKRHGHNFQNRGLKRIAGVRSCSQTIPEALAKIWRAAGSKVRAFSYMVRKLRSIAFQRCIWRGGLPLVEMAENEDFLKKKAWKTAF